MVSLIMKTKIFALNLGLILICLLFTALLAPFFQAGLSSVDGNLLINTTNYLTNSGSLLTSRYPGHPSMELYILFPLALIMKTAFNVMFSWRIYIIMQFIFSLAAIIVFYNVMLLLSNDKLWAAIYTFILTFSNIFMIVHIHSLIMCTDNILESCKAHFYILFQQLLPHVEKVLQRKYHFLN